MNNNSSGMGRGNSRPVPAPFANIVHSFDMVHEMSNCLSVDGSRALNHNRVIERLRSFNHPADSNLVEGPMSSSKKITFEFKAEEIGMLKVALAQHVRTLGAYTYSTDRAQQMMYRTLLAKVEQTRRLGQ